MRLYVLRHGLAVDRDSPTCPPDPERPLTEEGKKKTRGACLGLRALEVTPHRILSSPWIRAAETAEIAARVLGLAKVLETDTLVPGEAPKRLLALLQPRETVMVVGHAPDLDSLIAFALTGVPRPLTSLKKAGCACLELDHLPEPGGRLVWLHEPKVLRRLGAELE